MNIIVVKTPEGLAEAAYKLIEQVVKSKENPVLGMATVLQHHPNVTVIADQEALSLCSEAIADEYR